MSKPVYVGDTVCPVCNEDAVALVSPAVRTIYWCAAGHIVDYDYTGVKSNWAILSQPKEESR